MGVSFKGRHSSTLYVLCYRPPRSDKTYFVIGLRNFVLAEHKNFKHICILGDFNFQDISWERENYFSATEADYMFLQFLTDFNFVQHHGIASTVHGNVLDLV